ncbi:unnamed protein product [Arctogadus glacialis]
MQGFCPLLLLLSYVSVFRVHVSVVTAVELPRGRGDSKPGSPAGCHSDRDKDDRPRQNCTAGGFSNIPSGLEPTTEVLLLPINQLSSLSWSDYSMFPKIYEIDLTSNQIHALSDISEGGLKTLRVLRLGSNGLEVLADGCFSPFPFLAELYLPHNSLVSLPDDVFRDLNKLEILDLSSNRIIVLPPNIIYPLEVIETLYLENNKIQTIPDDWFSAQDMGIPYLFLSANPWRCSCSLGYLHDYLLEFETSVYVRNGTVVNLRPKSVVCHSPGRLQGRPFQWYRYIDDHPDAQHHRGDGRRGNGRRTDRGRRVPAGGQTRRRRACVLRLAVCRVRVAVRAVAGVHGAVHGVAGPVVPPGARSPPQRRTEAGLGGVGRRDEGERKGRGRGGGGGEEESVSREESFRLFSRQEEIACRLAGAGGGALGARYSVVLREEREGGEGAARDWVVGGWAVTPGTGAVRSSWGEWLTHYLPNMPWGAAMPSDSTPAE